MIFELHTVGHVFETYRVEADNAKEAKRMFEEGLVIDPILSEVSGVRVDYLLEIE